MPTAFPLPLECFQLIIRHLASEGKGYTLASLLRVNRYVCAATLPIMYEDPFRLYFYRRLKFLSVDGFAPHLMLVRVLLLSVPENHVTELLRVAYLQDEAGPVEQLATWKIAFSYYSYVTNIDFESHSLAYNGGFGIDYLHAGLPAYLERAGHASRYLRENIAFHPSPNCTIAYGAAEDLRRDLTWALCANAERIRTLVISLADVARYLPLVPRFKVLSDVTFRMDSDLPTGGTQEWPQEKQDALSLRRTERIQRLEEMISFVQEHRRLHPNVLTRGLCKRKDTPFSGEECPQEYQHRLLQALPPLINPRVLDRNNWTHFAAKAQDTDLSFVKSIDSFNPTAAERASGRIDIIIPLLHRCRALESIKAASLGDDTFQWAVDERRQHNLEIAAGRTPQRPLVPLRSYAAGYQYPSSGHQINDVLFAFNDTLEVVSVHGFRSQDSDDTDTPELSIGDDDSNWDHSKLLALNINTNISLLRIHPNFLSRCPHSTHVFLTDARREYSLAEIAYWRPAELPRLTHLVLRGTPAISFHPDTLKSTKELVTLNLNVGPYLEDVCLIPPPEDIDDDEHGEPNEGEPDSNTPSTLSPRRPIWTWDWDLPKLVTLKLDSEFAYRFQFKMLDRTPSLAIFSVILRSASIAHRRTIGVADLFKPGSVHPQSSSFTTTDTEYIHLPALTEFSLCGTWTLDGQVLMSLFSRVAPKIERLTMYGCVGFRLPEWVGSTSSHLHRLQHASVRMNVDSETVSSAGLRFSHDDGRDRVDVYCMIDRPEGRIPEKPAEYIFEHSLR
ncbi:hypothetical protein BGX33_009763 [Mortierella sp. NVP41]|nr:hypothetical protein BGX33_009763 [Mortierella sp. NVP41]